jgi:PAS domain S-box-containing protein
MLNILKHNVKSILLINVMLVILFQFTLLTYQKSGMMSLDSFYYLSCVFVVLLAVITVLVLYIVHLHGKAEARTQVAETQQLSLQKLSVSLERMIQTQAADLQTIKERLEREVTERRRAETNLGHARDYAGNLINSSSDMIISVDENRNVIEFNRAAELALGYTKEEVIGRPIMQLYASEEEGRRVVECMKRDGVFRGEVQNVRKNGETFYSYVSASMMHDAAGKFIGVMGISRDITERKIAEEKLKLYAAELERSNRELQQFAYVASHDLQEPLRMVTSYLQLIERRYKEQLDTDAHEFIGFAVDGAKRMHNLINDLLAYSRVSTHAQPVQAVNGEEVFGTVLANLTAAREESGAEITHDLLPTIMFDPTQLAQLLQNLLSNAIKFRTRKEVPRIHIGTEDDHADWLITVRDNGIGIDPANLSRIFNIFQRLHTTAEYPGTGIGLAICKKIVERHGGRIWAESEPGQGTAFCFTIPKMKGNS